MSIDPAARRGKDASAFGGASAGNNGALGFRTRA
jgi:hypothetical protein